MRAQQLLVLCGLVLTGNIAIGAQLEQDDVPSRCWDACGSVVGVSQRCDNQHDDDFAEMQCICSWDAAKTQIPLCAACISQPGNRDTRHGDADDHDDHDDHDWDDNEALDLVHFCRFTTTTYNAAAATTLSASTTRATDPAATVATTSAAGSSTSSSRDSAQSTGSAATASPTNGAGEGVTTPGIISLAAVAGLLPLAWL